MSAREQYDRLSLEIKTATEEYEKVNQAHWQQNQAKERERECSVRQIIKEEGLLNLCTWHLQVHNRKPFLLAKERSGDKRVRPLSALAERDYHSSFYFCYFKDGDQSRGKEIALRFDDGDIRLIFDDPADIGPFIKEYGMKVHITHVDKEIASLQASIDSLNEVKSLLL